MRRMKAGESAINIYFTAIAVLDLIILWINTLSMWLFHMFEIRTSAVHTVVCKVHTWIGTMSCWCVVCMTVHRAMSVVWPHRVNLLCTRRTVLLVITGVIVFFAILYSHYLIGFETVNVNGQYWCYLGPNDASYGYFVEHIFVYIELTVYSALPFIFLVVSNSILVWKLSQSVRAAAGGKLTQGDPEQAEARERAARSVTRTVILVSVAFLVITLPNSINYIVNFLFQANSASGYESAESSFINAVCGVLTNVNYAVNFYLYCLTGRRFREEFINVLCCGRSRRRLEN
ncbi:hypothetical protein ACOMHN_032390 [Nucella lapillus]